MQSLWLANRLERTRETPLPRALPLLTGVDEPILLPMHAAEKNQSHFFVEARSTRLAPITGKLSLSHNLTITYKT
jgi:hypothetical protein